MEAVDPVAEVVPGVPVGLLTPAPAPRLDRVADAPAVTVGNRPPRATPAAARAARNCASAWAIDWLETETCSSNALSCGSPKTSHHLPRGISSAGVAVFQFGGGGSLKAAGDAAG